MQLGLDARISVHPPVGRPAVKGTSPTTRPPSPPSCRSRQAPDQPPCCSSRVPSGVRPSPRSGGRPAAGRSHQQRPNLKPGNGSNFLRPRPLNLRAHNPKVAGSNPAPATHERPAQAGLSPSRGVGARRLVVPMWFQFLVVSPVRGTLRQIAIPCVDARSSRYGHASNARLIASKQSPFAGRKPVPWRAFESTQPETCRYFFPSGLSTTWLRWTLMTPSARRSSL